jgi:hypothetical protein
MEFKAERCGITLFQLLQPFVVKINSVASAAQVSVMLDPCVARSV